LQGKADEKIKRSLKWNISVCGLNCARCDIYMAGHGDTKLRGEILDWFKKERNEPLEPEKIKCDGCRGSLNTHWSSDCEMMLCAKKNELQYCFQCKDFPCKTVNKFSSDDVSHHKKTIENSKRMKEIGLELWIEEQRKKGQCLFCP
jgi:hypothetical protein